MAQDVVTLLFAGQADKLLAAYAAGVRGYQAAGGRAPEQAVIATGDAGLMVTLVWGDGVPHDGLGRHLLPLLAELGLPFPQLQHGTLTTSDWQHLATLGSSQPA